MIEQIGIDQLNFYGPEFYLDLEELAQARQVDPNKFKIGIGQDQMAIIPADQDIVTMAANAAAPIISADDKQTIDLIIFATESGIDQSKSAALYLQHLLGLGHKTRAIEIKEACYGATAGLQLAYDHLASHPKSQKVLVVGADVARYGIATAGEVTQGAGAIAMIITRQPRILALEQPSAFYSEDIMDFWRPNYSTTAFADGKYSTEQYLRFLNLTWTSFKQQTELALTDFNGLLFHIPFTKLGLKGLRQLTDELSDTQKRPFFEVFKAATVLNRRVGNLYTGSLYLSLLSLLGEQQLPGQARLGLFSYGSGAVGEFFSGRIVENYQSQLRYQQIKQQLDARKRVSVSEYEQMFLTELPLDGSTQVIEPMAKAGDFYLAGIEQHQRQYRRVE